MKLTNFQRRFLRNKLSRQNLFVSCAFVCLFVLCGHQVIKIKEMEKNVEIKHDAYELKVSEPIKHIPSEYRLFQPAEAIEFPTVPNGIPRIPHIVHQICDSEEVLDIFADPMRSFVENNPTWEYRFWTYKSGRNFLTQRYPYLIAIYDAFGKNDVRKSDLLRFAVIYEYGGVYADLDVKNLRPLNITTIKYACIVPTEPFEHSAIFYRMEVLLSTAVLLCRPKHPFFKQLLLNLQFADPGGEPLDTTGPMYVTNLYMLYNNINETDMRKTKTDNSSNSPYFYKGTRREDDDDAVYTPNSQYFMDSLDKSSFTKNRSLDDCIHKPKSTVNKIDLVLENRACNEFESRKTLRRDRTFTFTHHYWFHMWTFSTKYLMMYEKKHIKDIIPNCISFSE